MATRYALTGDVNDLLGGEVRRAHVRIVTNLPPRTAVIDSTNKTINLGAGAPTVGTDGKFSASLIATDATDLNVTGLQYRVIIEAAATGGREVFDSGYFSLTADADIAELDLQQPALVPSGSGSGSSALIVVSGGTIDLDNTKPDGYLIGYRVTATTTIEGVSFAAGSYIFERDSGVYGGWTYRTLDTATQVVPSPESVPPTAGTIAASSVTDTTATITVSDASDETALAAAAYDFSADNGSTWTGYQSSPIKNLTGLSPSTAYQVRHRVKDAAGNVTVGTAITVTTLAAALAPSDVGTLFFDYDANTGTTVYASETNISQIADGTGGGRHLVAAASTSAPDRVTLNGNTAAQFTPANSDRLRYVGSYTLAASTGYSLCWVGRIDTLANATLLSAIGATIRMTSTGAVSASTASTIAQTLVGTVAVAAGGTYLITAAVTTGSVTLRVGATKDVEAGTTADATNNLSLSALYSGTGSEFAAVTVGRVWGYAKAISDAEHEGLRAWAQGEWGVA